MGAPSKAYVAVADSQVDADSPIDATLMTALRDDIVNLYEQLCFGYTPAQAHNHDGANSALVGSVADNAITGNKISKTVVSTGTQTINPGATWTPAAGVYNFVPVQSTSDTSLTVLQINISGWYGVLPGTTGGAAPGAVYCDGSNMRFSNPATLSGYTSTIYYQKF